MEIVYLLLVLASGVCLMRYLLLWREWVKLNRAIRQKGGHFTVPLSPKWAQISAILMILSYLVKYLV